MCARENENRFREIVEPQIPDHFHGGKFFKIESEGETLESQIDFYINYNDKTYLIEIDSNNNTKILVGQYLLLNDIIRKNRANYPGNYVFVVVHYYGGFNINRTKKYFNFVKTEHRLHIPYIVLSADDVEDGVPFLQLVNDNEQ